MPITQDRMLALIDAARDYQQAWKRAVQFLNSQNDAITAGRATHEQSWNQLLTVMSSSMALESPITTTETITRETEHFRHAKQRNIKSAKWQRTKRGQQHINEITADTDLALGDDAKASIGDFLSGLEQQGE